MIGRTNVVGGNINTNNATATPDTILEGYSAYVKGDKIEGNIATYTGQSKGNGKPLEVNIPDAIASSGYIYTFNIDNEYVLVSGSEHSTKVGLWLCNIVTDTWTQLLPKTNSYNCEYKYFYKVKDKVVISSSYQYNTGLYVYNHITKTCGKKFSLGYNYTYSCLVNDTLLISGNSGALRFDYNSELFEEIFNESGGKISFSSFYQYGNKALCVSSNGIYVYNDLDKSVEKILPVYAETPYIRQTEHGTVVAYRTEDGRYLALLDKNFDTVLSQVEASSGSFDINSKDNHIEHKNGELYGGGYTNTIGYYWFDFKNTTLEKVYEQGYGFSTNYTKNFNKYIFFVPNSTMGCVLFDTETKEFIRPIETKNAYLATLINNKLVLTHYNTTHKGLYLFDIDTRELTPLNTTSYVSYHSTNVNVYTTNSYQIKDRIIASFYGLGYVIDLTDNTYKSGGGASVDVTNIEYLLSEGGNNLFINSKGANVRCYNYETNEFILALSQSTETPSEIYSKVYNVYELDGENCYAYNNDKTSNPYTLYFDSTQNKWLIDKYYLGEI